MTTFEQLWAVLYDHGASAKKEEGTRRFWFTQSSQQQEQVFTTITTKLRENKFVQYDPIRAIKENIRQLHQQQTLSYAEYYQRYGTTEETDGWKRQFVPEERKTVYVRN